MSNTEGSDSRGADGSRPVSVHRSVCHLCHGGCGSLLHVQDGKLLEIRPDKDSPFSKGFMCQKGLATPEYMYHPDRLTRPLKRIGERGEGKWAPISWEAALQEIAGRLRSALDELGPETIALGQGTARPQYCHVRRFANALGTPNWYEPGLANCFIPRVAASVHTYGGLLVGDYCGEVAPRTVLVWGCNPVVSNPDGKLAFRIRNVLKSGAHGIAIDPRRSETAVLCRDWIPIRPGTDGALALALIHVILAMGWYDREFVDQKTRGLEELRDSVRDKTPAWAHEVTGIESETIVRIARTYALERPSVIEWGVALDQCINSFQTARSLCILRALTGNIDRPGAEVFGNKLLAPFPLLQDKLKLSAIRKRIGGTRFPLLGGPAAHLPSAHMATLFEAISTGKPYPVTELLIFGNNPLATVANPRKVKEALGRLRTLVVADMFMTPTAALADYVLPAAFWPEIDHVTELPAFAPKAVVAQRKIVKVGECRSDAEVLNELSRLLGLPGSTDSVRDILDFQLKPLGLDFRAMEERVTIDTPIQYGKRLETSFETKSGKVELFAKSLLPLGIDPLPEYRAHPELRREEGDFPYDLTTGPRRSQFFHSEQRQEGRLKARRRFPCAEMHPSTAATHSIENGDWVDVISRRGRIRMKAVVTTRILESVISIDHGWWDPGDPTGEKGVFGSNANVLTSDGPPYDHAFGSNQLRGIGCRIERAKKDEIRQSVDNKIRRNQKCA